MVKEIQKCLLSLLSPLSHSFYQTNLKRKKKKENLEEENHSQMLEVHSKEDFEEEDFEEKAEDIQIGKYVASSLQE